MTLIVSQIPEEHKENKFQKTTEAYVRNHNNFCS